MPLADEVPPRRGGRPAAQTDGVEALRAASHRQLLDSAVETLVEEWAGAVPELERDVRAIAARIARIGERLQRAAAALLKRSELSDNEFRLLAGLMRLGAPYRCAPTDLAGRYVPVTTGGLTGLVRRLERRGLVCRVSHPSDQRSVLVELTPEGRTLAHSTMTSFAEMEALLMGALSPAEKEDGNRFLRKLLHSIEKSAP